MRGLVRAAVLVAMLASSGRCAEMTEEEILGQADARIEKHRTGDSVFQLLGPDGQIGRASCRERV